VRAISFAVELDLARPQRPLLESRLRRFHGRVEPVDGYNGESAVSANMRLREDAIK
jgi:hypothetical protein